MVIKLWSDFSKRRNSTKQPIDADAVSYDVKLKENCSIESPSFILNTTNFTFNYCQAFGHYYYIDNITFINNTMIQIDCVQDLLATYKTEIQNTSAYVSYSSTYDSSLINDPRCVTKVSPEVKTVSASINGLSDTGCYIVNVVNDNPGNTGFTASYLMDAARLKQLAHYLNASITDEPLSWLQATLLKPYDAIASIIWLPVSFSTVAAYCGTSAVESIKLGKDVVSEVSDTFKIDKTQPVQISTVISSISWPYTDFRKGAPYTQAKLLLPFYGTIDINPVDVIGTLQIDLYIDPMSGDATYIITSHKGSGANVQIKQISTINFSIGAVCPLGQSINQGTGAVSSISGAVTGAITAGVTGGVSAATGAISAIASGINAGVSLASTSNSVKGSIAGRSFIGMGTDIKLVITTLNTIDPVNMTALKGRPVMQVKAISSLSGYVECVDASVNIAGLGSDKELINTYLNGGIYLE